MKIDLIGMILNNAGRRCFEGAMIDDVGNPLDAANSLDLLIMEYAKVRQGGESSAVVLSPYVKQSADAQASLPVTLAQAREAGERGEKAVLIELLKQCVAILATVEPENSEEGDELIRVQVAINKVTGGFWQ